MSIERAPANGPTASARREGWQALGRLLALCLLLLAGCSSSNPYYDPAKAHHTPGGFRNNHAHEETWSADLLRWQWQRWRQNLPQPPRTAILPVVAELDFIRTNRVETAVTWIGHATVLLQTAGLNIITDPQFSDRASPFSFAGPKRHQRPGIALADLPRIDAVLISHNHYDHLDLASVRALYRQAGGPPVFYVPLGVDLWFQAHVTDGSTERLRRMDWWESIAHEGVRLDFLPVQHWSARTPWDRDKTLWGAWAVRHPGFSFFFSGDLGYSRDIPDIGQRISGFDLAAIAIGAYEPRWFMGTKHVNPQEAVRVHQELGARRSFGIHWGTFSGISDEPLDQPPRDLEAARQAAGVSAEEFFVLKHGETYRPASR
jgi:L-ascorbate metabolism protein UlaG (beta-lactamase superfamily)